MFKMIRFSYFFLKNSPFQNSGYSTLFKIKNWLVTITLLFILCVNAQTKPIQYTLNWVDEKKGLMQQNVTFALPDKNGFIWIGTNLGLYKYDGLKATKINSSVYSKSKTDKYIIHLAKEIHSENIFGELDPGNSLIKINNDKITTLKKNNKSFFTFNQHFFSSSNPIVKIAQRNPLFKEILDKYYQRKFQTAFVTDNYLYLPTKNQLFIFNKYSSINKIKLDVGENDNHLLLQFGDSILSIENKKISLIVNGTLSSFKVKFDNRIRDFIKNKNANNQNFNFFGDYTNRYYLNSNGRIYEINYRNNILNTKYLFDSPTNEINNIVYYEKIQSYILSTETKGFVILTPNKFQSLNFDGDHFNQILNFTYAVVPINNDLWFSSSGWTYDYKANSYKTDNFYYDRMNYRSLLYYGNNYFSHKNNNFYNVINKKNNYGFSINKILKKEIDPFVCSFLHDNNLWISSEKKLYYLKNKQLVKDLNFRYKIPKIFNVLSLDKSNLIIATESGVFNYNTNKKEINVIPKLEKVFARYIKIISKNTFWVGCYGDGLFLVKNNNAFKVVDKNIELNTAHAIEEDYKGMLWISTNDGLLTIDKNILIKNTLNHELVEFYRFSTDDGLLTNEFNGGSTHPSLNNNEGIIGFPSMKGFIWFNPNLVKKHLFEGKIVIDNVRVNNFKNIPIINNSLSIPNWADIISLNFSYGYYFNRQNISISYRFEDQKKWKQVKGNVIQIGRNKKGKQKFLIRISTHGYDTKQGVIQTIKIDFEERYYELWWFWFICFIFFGILIYFAYFIGLSLDNIKKKQLENRIQEKTSQLQTVVLELESSKNSMAESLNEKNILLKEIHHRVKNNLQLVMSILNIQASDKENISIENFLEKGRIRINSIVLIHESLYQQEDVGNIDIKNYIENLIQNLQNSYEEYDKNITIVLDIKGIYLNLQTAIPLGLIVNELATNSFKHAFNKMINGTIYISIIESEINSYSLTFSDNGHFCTILNDRKKSIGLELVSLLILQLNGKLKRKDKDSAHYFIEFHSI